MNVSFQVITNTRQFLHATENKQKMSCKDREITYLRQRFYLLKDKNY